MNQIDKNTTEYAMELKFLSEADVNGTAKLLAESFLAKNPLWMDC